MTDMEVVKAAGARSVRISVLTVECPRCGAGCDYEPGEDDAGAYYAGEEWPICEGCKVVIEPPVLTLQQATHDTPYFIRRT